MNTIIRADQVGSLLRPESLLALRRDFKAGKISRTVLTDGEDQAIRAALALQAESGIGVQSDGEFRRSAWGSGVLESLSGLTPAPTGPEAAKVPSRWQGEHAKLAEAAVAAEFYVATSKINLKHRFALQEARFLRENATRPYKITMPSPSMFPRRLFNASLSAPAYLSPDELLEDLLRIYLEEIDALHEVGVPYMQLDSLRYIDTIDDVDKGRIKAADAKDSLRKLVAIDQRVLTHMKRPGVTRGLHICRGNNRSSWGASGSYESVAEMLLGEVDADRFLMEFDTERAGSFEPLRFVPPGKIVVLGLVTTKTGALEDPDELMRRIEAASRYVPLDYLALSPQCGFASTELGNLLTVDEEKRKLELVAEVARRVWG
jgi:5-methyltetrahydropteroyltriglutamate--homocysteine methyltransferase